MKYANIRAEVEIMVEWPDDAILTDGTFKLLLQNAIDTGKWVHVALAKVVHIFKG